MTSLWTCLQIPNQSSPTLVWAVETTRKIDVSNGQEPIIQSRLSVAPEVSMNLEMFLTLFAEQEAFLLHRDDLFSGRQAFIPGCLQLHHMLCELAPCCLCPRAQHNDAEEARYLLVSQFLFSLHFSTVLTCSSPLRSLTFLEDGAVKLCRPVSGAHV